MIFGSILWSPVFQIRIFLTILVKRAGKWYVLIPNILATAEKSDEWVQIKPDTDAVFALAAAKYIIDEGLFDQEYVSNFLIYLFSLILIQASAYWLVMLLD